MADIFLSYKREDQSLAKDLAGKLIAEGWSVWWDRDIPAGRAFDQVIEDELAKAKCIIVLWTPLSVVSTNVKEEAWAGLERKILIPVAIGNIHLPYGFKMIQTVSWNDNDQVEDFEFQELSKQIRELLGVQASGGSTQKTDPVKTPEMTSVQPPAQAGGGLKTATMTFTWPNTAGKVYEALIPSIYNKGIKPLTSAVRVYIDEMEVAKLDLNESATVQVTAGTHNLHLKCLGTFGKSADFSINPGEHITIRIKSGLTGLKYTQTLEQS